MKATSIITLRKSVIALLHEAGYSPIEAVDKWDRVYSRQIQEAAPGTHTLIIGKWTLEYTKPSIPSPVDLNELIEQERGTTASPALFIWVVIFAAITITTLFVIVFH